MQTNYPIPADELARRHDTCRTLLASLCPEAQGMLLFSRVSCYYMSGTLGNSIFWLPLTGDPVLLVRKNVDRAKLESPLPIIEPFRSYSDLKHFIELEDGTLPSAIAFEKNALPWNLADLLMSKLPSVRVLAADPVIQQARAIKSDWELERLKIAGEKHHQVLSQRLLPLLHSEMSELDVAYACWNACFSLGHAGLLRMSAFGEESFLGHIAIGESGNYPSHYNGPLALRGVHPATPVMGNSDVHWQKNSLLSVDIGFVYEGYITDKTQIYFNGSASDIPDVVKRAHETCLTIERTISSMMVPGTPLASLYAKCLDIANEAGFADGFMGLGKNKVPFLGHSIGLTIDEWPVVARQFPQPVEVGMTLALEPKIGVPGYGMVGSENTYAVTAKGTICLTGGPADIICLSA